MGEAKRKAAARREMNAELKKIIIPRLSAALRKLCNSASGNIGSDCYSHAVIAREILGRLRIEATVCCGAAAWRCGEFDQDCIVHAPIDGMIDQPGVPYHVWLEIGDNLYDPTLYTIPDKAKALDKLDGGTTMVIWAPPYLFAPLRSVSSLRDVTRLSAGKYFYERVPEVEKRIFEDAPELDMTAVEATWMLYNNQDMKVFGPNDMKEILSVDAESGLCSDEEFVKIAEIEKALENDTITDDHKNFLKPDKAADER